MHEIERILDQLQRAFDGEAWAGPSLQATLAGITAAQAAAYPLAGAHSIWEIVLHLETWLHIVCRRLETATLLGPTDAENWPAPPALPNEEAWRATQDYLRQAHDQLRAVIGNLQDTDLTRRGTSPGNIPDSTSNSWYVMLQGVIQHTYYHTGQIALLRKAFA
ncbi:DinB family protein [Hymenobacter mucosus]|uniref:Uncharacterized damage-inducible protein DinB (Forms a four-helix bundle) n=1 Tax=Hymenobacter mucosus TaxID=1411120 RepID=A0A238WDU7_9BACT|nr:DinB family protein [Hymenobacter mucosus]SNR44597.1 Uncharacterized damage-inducible protein DinB (forms a four-helix bundle) [Hymenobacter mucosus]